MFTRTISFLFSIIGTLIFLVGTVLLIPSTMHSPLIGVGWMICGIFLNMISYYIWKKTQKDKWSPIIF